MPVVKVQYCVHQKVEKKGHKGTLESVACVCYIDCGDASWVFAHVQSHQIVHIKYVISLYIHYTSVSLLKNTSVNRGRRPWLKWDWRKLNTLEEHLIFFRDQVD